MTHAAPTVTYETFTANDDQSIAFRDAIEELSDSLGQEHGYYVAGEERFGDCWEEERSPGDDRILVGKFATATKADLDDAITAARSTQPAWAKTPWRERIEIISRISGLVDERRYELAAILAFEIGKPILEALGEVDELIALVDGYCADMRAHAGYVKTMSRTATENAVSVMRPYGVWLVIGPFNFAQALCLGPVVAALIAGNAAVLKPSPAAYWSGLKVHELIRDAGVPAGVLSTVTLPDSRLDGLLSRMDIDGLTFTGSYETGMKIFNGFQQAYPRPTICEMGGKNAAIVTAHADLDKAAQGVARSAFGFSGQRCSGCERALVDSSVYDEFVARLEKHRAQFKVGSPLDPQVQAGPVISSESVSRHLQAVAEARASGYRVLGGQRLGGDLEHGHFVEPTVVEAKAGSRLLRDEMFTPFVAVTPVDSLGDAIDQANGLDLALTAGIFSEDPGEVSEFLDRIQAGVVYVNRAAGATTGAWPGVQPFGGWRGSGSTGRGAGGPYYLEQYLREQSRTIVGGVVEEAV
jgi:1-pyrroline-5-carboxylate dehydrogenase